MAIHPQFSQFYCSKCNCILKEVTSSVDCTPYLGSEHCPSCDRLLSETLQVKRSKRSGFQLPVKPKTAYELAAKLTFDIEQIDRSVTLSIGDRVSITGPRRYANLLITRLWVRALMPQRYGGLASKTVLCIDGGNCANVYQCVSFARQYGMEARSVLRSIIISRAFTIHQLARLIIRSLPEAISRFDTKVVVISDLLEMFLDDPQIRQREARYLLGEILKAIAKLPDDILVLLSLYNVPSKYDGMILSSFGKRIAIVNEENRFKVRLFNNQDMFSEFPLVDADLRIVSSR